jgi:hypothetical protein
VRRHGASAAAGVVAMLVLAGAAAAAATIAPARARAIVAAVELRHADLPGTTAVPDPLTKQGRKLDDQLTACIGGVPISRDVAAAQSPGFISRKDTSLAWVGSFADVLPSTALVTADFVASARRRALPCDTKGALDSLSPLGNNVRVASAKSAFIAPPLPGLQHEWASRTTVVLAQTSPGIPVLAAADLPPSYVDLLTGAVGQVEFEIEIVSSRWPPPVTAERRLLTLLAARARKALG